MSDQCKLDKTQFVEFANCTLSEEQYVEILKSNGEIE
jgi:hypothetical protein